MKSHYLMCLQMFPNARIKRSPKTLNPKVPSFSFPSFSLLNLYQNMINEVLNSTQISRKLYPDFHISRHDLQLVHRTNWPLSTKLCSDFILSHPDFCWNKTPKTTPNCATIFTKLNCEVPGTNSGHGVQPYNFDIYHLSYDF